MKIEIGEPSLPPVTVSDIKTDLVLHYGGKKGETKRVITLNELKGVQLPDGTIRIDTIKAYCHERKMARSFAIDSVQSLHVPGTGEVIGDLLEWLKTKG
ncbi:hypothetical protein AA101099_1798 [Neoasaia chiangmaiensis NBRC 101099]|uniref:Uncharacterized protein n=1 Tax=Neoasaia chiangmaiensis TaxID=320497 RepID=A0A1U9KR73_9PROT|nr:hypothetical protein [Neoasaia chiangmaiensis]AQS88245.1 hypothetical protein A0U93_10180 [Neoasaia chiangmaiensis]GBR39743.1 hypothetical protein AA101099_1798 [Neoasaia chiangmaiensis NBRC 101099]GEN14721.1 hypothetical protein NCH01_11520 [Neoasaia chiangmaiensis]